mmetsp:Transcript_76849/g.212356  ORF Transcript_76849/g.212356 Transcript_76849/m.212356 type:complete len:205 (-) Transcript_76849:791-1405(-)
MKRPDCRTSALASAMALTAASVMGLRSAPLPLLRPRSWRWASMARHQVALARISARRCAAPVSSCVRRRASEAVRQTSRRAASASSAMKAFVSAARRRIAGTHSSISESILRPRDAKSSPAHRKAFFARADRRDSTSPTMTLTSRFTWPHPTRSRGAKRESLLASSMAPNCSDQSAPDSRRFSTSTTKRSSGGAAKGASSSRAR